MTGSELASRVLGEIGVLGAGQTPSAEDATVVLQAAGRLFGVWATERLTVINQLRTTKALTSGTRDYTIGTSGDINIARPIGIDHATVILDNTATDPLELPIRVFTEDQWAGIGQKTLDSASIEGIFYDAAFSSAARGTISTFPTINISTATLVLYTPKATVGWTALTDDLVFPPGYEEAIHYGVSVRCCRPFGRQVTRDLQTQAETAESAIKTVNVRMSDLAVVTPWTTGVYDINTDTSR
jgi:hypothetical protein